jgi:hypothetical protein
MILAPAIDGLVEHAHATEAALHLGHVGRLPVLLARRMPPAHTAPNQIHNHTLLRRNMKHPCQWPLLRRIRPSLPAAFLTPEQPNARRSRAETHLPARSSRMLPRCVDPLSGASRDGNGSSADDRLSDKARARPPSPAMLPPLPPLAWAEVGRLLPAVGGRPLNSFARSRPPSSSSPLLSGRRLCSFSRARVSNSS